MTNITLQSEEVEVLFLKELDGMNGQILNEYVIAGARIMEGQDEEYEFLGEGVQSRVYRVLDDGKVLKMCRTDDNYDDVYEVYDSCTTDILAKVYTMFDIDGTEFMVQEKVTPLSDFRSSKEKLNEVLEIRHGIKFLKNVLDLAYISNTSGCDLQDSNVGLAKDGAIKVHDWGLFDITLGCEDYNLGETLTDLYENEWFLILLDKMGIRKELGSLPKRDIAQYLYKYTKEALKEEKVMPQKTIPHYKKLEYAQFTEKTTIISYAEDLVELSFIEQFVEGIEKIENDDPETFNFNELGSGSYATAYSYNGYVIKRNRKSKEDQNIFYEYEMGMKLNKYSTFPKTYALIERGKYFYVITERVYGNEIDNIYNNVDILNPEGLETFKKEIVAVVKEGIEPRDLHGGNIMIDTEGNVKIIDIGYFKDRGEELLKGDETDEEIFSTYGHVYSVSLFSDTLKIVNKFKEEFAVGFKKENLFVERAFNETYIHQSRKNLRINDKKGLIGRFLNLIKEDEYLKLNNIGDGSHSEVYSFEYDDDNYVLKVQEYQTEKFYKEQIRIMKIVSMFPSFLENIAYYHDEDRNKLFILQEQLEHVVAKNPLLGGEEKKGRITKVDNFAKNMKLFLQKSNLIPNDMHDENVAYANSDLNIFCFDTSYFFDLDSKHGKSLIKNCSNSFGQKEFNSTIGIDYWKDDLVKMILEKEKEELEKNA